MKSWLEISEERLAANYARLAAAAGPGTCLLAVIKANAYGHGAAICAPILARAGACWLGVTDAAEAEVVLDAVSGLPQRPEILVMSGLLPEDAEAMVRLGLTPVVWQRQQIDWLAAAARVSGATVAVHLEIDTGMSRQGVCVGAELDELLAYIKAEPRIRLDGVMTHFASAEIVGSVQTTAQRSRFDEAVAAVAKAGLKPAWVHAGNSSMLDTESSEQAVAWLRGVASSLAARSMVRTGIALYGYCLPVESAGRLRVPPQAEVLGAAAPGGHAPGADVPGADVPGADVQPDLRPVMTWKTRVIGLREVHPGDTVGYNAIFTAHAPMRLALLPVGYADGLRRELSGSNARPGGWAMVQGRRAAIVGRVSMNLTLVNVTGIANVDLGDEVVVLGDGVTADDHAGLAHTIAYEILCGVQAVARTCV